jgi:5-deoxy-glucuronate isomerase
MANWVYPLGSAAEGSWDISLGTADSALDVAGWAHTGLKVATLAAGADVELPAAGEERIVVPLSGSFTAAVDGQDYALVGRASVFSGPSDVLYPGTGRAVSIRSADGGRELLPPGSQLWHAGRTGSGPLHRLRSDHAGGQLVFLPSAQA